jgi:chromosome segregation ATPase
MDVLAREGLRDLSRRARILWLRAACLWLRQALSKGEADLGFLGWEQVDFFDSKINSEVEKVRQFEHAQASLLNVSAELSGRRAALDQELAQEKALYDQARASLAQEREPIAAQAGQAEAAHRRKLEAAERFERAIAELADQEKRLRTLSASLMTVENPTPEIQTETRDVNDRLRRLPGERKLVLADKVNAARDAASIATEITRLHAELQRIDTEASAAHDRFAAASHRLAAETRRLERERKESNVRISRLDRGKREPYRLIGACLADHNIAPLNQPEVLAKVQALRERNAMVAEMLSELRASRSQVDAAVLLAFYLALAAVLLAIFAVAAHFAH